MKTTANLRRRILSRTASVAVIGQGYVGLSLACGAAEQGFPTLGLDINEERVRALTAGQPVVPGVNGELFRSGVDSGNLTFTTDPAGVGDADIVLICVPTPVLGDDTPDLSFVVQASEQVGDRLQAGRLVVLESTTYPGTTDELVKPILEERSGLKAGKDFLLAYSPERIDPGNAEFGLRTTPKVVGGHTPEATGLTALFYGQVCEKVVSVSSTRSAELTKLLENAFRHVNIALVNELATVCHEVGIDVYEVLEAAASKPFGFMPFTPGPGVGGHCIPLDSAYLAWQVRRDAGHPFRLLEQAQDINEQMPAYVVSRIAEALNEKGKPMKDAKVLVLGVSYKADLGDTRESPALKVMAHLKKKGCAVKFHDPFIEEVAAGDVTYQRTELTAASVRAADCVAVMTAHSAYDFAWLADHAEMIFDARNALGDDRRTNVVRL